MQVSDAAKRSAIITTTIDISIYQVIMLAKKGQLVLTKEGNSYTMNTLTLSKCIIHGDGVNGSSKNKVNRKIKPPYFLNTITFF